MESWRSFYPKATFLLTKPPAHLEVAGQPWNSVLDQLIPSSSIQGTTHLVLLLTLVYLWITSVFSLYGMLCTTVAISIIASCLLRIAPLLYPITFSCDLLSIDILLHATYSLKYLIVKSNNYFMCGLRIDMFLHATCSLKCLIVNRDNYM